MSLQTTEDPSPRPPAFFGWTVANILAACFALAAWVGCYALFQFPEVPSHYRILEKLGRLPKPTTFKLEDRPKGKLLDPEGCYTTFVNLPDKHLETLNRHFLRNHLTNYQDPRKLYYLTGRWQWTQIAPLGPSDLAHPGYSLRAQAIVTRGLEERDFPYPVILHCLVPTPKKLTPEQKQTILQQPPFQLKITPHALAILHLQRLGPPDELEIHLTVSSLTGSLPSMPKALAEQLTYQLPTAYNPQAIMPPRTAQPAEPQPKKNEPPPKPTPPPQDKSPQSPAPQPEQEAQEEAASAR